MVRWHLLHKGRAVDVAPSVYDVARRVAQHRRTNAYKIGYTNNPRMRLSKHREHYDEMIVLYQTRSLDSALNMEAWLISEMWCSNDNAIGGGGGKVGEPPYFVYLVRCICA